MDREPSHIFSFQLQQVSLFKAMVMLLSPLFKKRVKGLLHSESFFTMNLGEPVFSFRRYNFRKIATFMLWNSEADFDSYSDSVVTSLQLKLKPYRKWGEVKEIESAKLYDLKVKESQSVVAVTLARLKIPQVFRFAKYGKPVEKQVRDHKGQTRSFACMRPPNTFCTFSMWKSEKDMESMVFKSNHHTAMQERNRKDFHFEFTTMRFIEL